jgi:hypothetical protein
MALREPGMLARMAYATLPKDVLVSVEQRIPSELEPESWALMLRVLDIVKKVMPEGAITGPDEVFGVIETAPRAHFAKQISG